MYIACVKRVCVVHRWLLEKFAHIAHKKNFFCKKKKSRQFYFADHYIWFCFYTDIVLRKWLLKRFFHSVFSKNLWPLSDASGSPYYLEEIKWQEFWKEYFFFFFVNCFMECRKYDQSVSTVALQFWRKTWFHLFIRHLLQKSLSNFFTVTCIDKKHQRDDKR